MPDTTSQICSLCGRRVPAAMITQHHLIPRERGGKPDDRVPMCRPCHKQIHVLFANRELASFYGELSALRRAPELQSFVRWIRKQASTANVVTRGPRHR